MDKLRKGCWWGLAMVTVLLLWPVFHTILDVLGDILFFVVALVFRILILVFQLSATLLLVLAGFVFAAILWVTRGK